MDTADQQSAQSTDKHDKKDDALIKPTLFTTLTDDESFYAGAAGACFFPQCSCRFYAGQQGKCQRCHHSNLHHAVAMTSAHVQQFHTERQQTALRYKNLNRQRILKERTQAKEADEKKQQEEKELISSATQSTNTYPCSVDDCDCKRFEMPLIQQQQREVSSPSTALQTQQSVRSADTSLLIGTAQVSVDGNSNNGDTQIQNEEKPPIADSAPIPPTISSSHSTILLTQSQASTIPVKPAASMPRLCRRCKHAEMYHVKVAKDKIGSNVSRSRGSTKQKVVQSGKAAKSPQQVKK